MPDFANSATCGNVPALPKPASMPARMLAFFADIIVAILVSVIVLKIVLPLFFGAELGVFETEARKLFEIPAQMMTWEETFARSQELAKNADVARVCDAGGTIFFFVSLAFFTLTEFFMRGSSLGKKIVRIRVVSQFPGSPAPTFWQSLSRSIWRACMIAPTGLIISLIVIVNAHIPFFSFRSRGWHDKLSRTEVIDERDPLK